jgi:hypothetical protein
MEGGKDWFHAGISVVKEKPDNNGVKRLVRIPDGIIWEEDSQYDILEIGEPVHWAYDMASEVLIVSGSRLKNREDYNPAGYHKLRVDNKNAKIPEGLFSEPGGKGQHHDAMRAGIDIDPFVIGEQRHFITNSEMASGDTRSCYVLNDVQFSKRFSGEWDGNLDQVPRFVP